MKKVKKKNIHDEEVRIPKKEKDFLEETLDLCKSIGEESPDIDNFFEAVKSRKKEFEEEENLKDEINKIEEEHVRENEFKVEPKSGKGLIIIKNFSLVIALLGGLAYYVLYVISAFNKVNYLERIINSSMLFTTILIFIMSLLVGKKILKNVLSIIASISLILFLSFNILVNYDIIKLKTLAVIGDLTNTSAASIMKLASNNHFEVSTTYENSDNIKEGYIISQSIDPASLLKDIKKLDVVISSGPNFDKKVMLKDMTGTKVDDLIEFLDKNHFNNYDINFELNNEIERDTIISQSTKGEITRNTYVSFSVSLGNKDALSSIKLKDLTNKSIKEATLYLKRNGINFNITYDYSNTIKKDRVISQSISKDTEVYPFNETVELVISKGPQIIVPDFKGKELNDILTWITDNDLTVGFNEEYNNDIEKGKFIKINYTAGDIISSGTKVVITTSMGPLVVPDYKSIGDLRSFASNYGMKIDENYVYNDKASGSIVDCNYLAGDKILPGSTINVTISYGKAVTVPYMVGKSKSEIARLCSSNSLYCSYYYTGYSNTSKDVATKQSLSSGSKVKQGTYVSIGLSSGPAKSYSVYIQSEWFASTADATISNLRNKLNGAAPGVTFNFVKKSSNSGFPGQIHPSSPVKGGNNSFTQGRTYTIWVIS